MVVTALGRQLTKREPTFTHLGFTDYKNLKALSFRPTSETGFMHIEKRKQKTFFNLNLR